MRSIVYGGRDFSDVCTAEAELLGAHGVAAETRAVPGRAGEVLVGARIEPLPIGVRLFLSLDGRLDEEGLARVRHELRARLLAPEGAELALPGEPGLSYRDCVCADAGPWDRLFEEGSCGLAFIAYDPIAYGEGRICRGGTVEVGGTWPTRPRFTMVAGAGAAVSVERVDTGERIEVARAFSGGETVAVDCSDGSVRVDGADARADLTLGSDLFRLDPGANELSFEGVTEFTTEFTERWA